MGHGRDRVGSHNIILHIFTDPLIFILTANPSSGTLAQEVPFKFATLQTLL